MAPYPDNFGRTRLKMRTPVKGLFQPKFVHGVLGSLLAGLQVNDMMLDRSVMNGNARLKCRDPGRGRNGMFKRIRENPLHR